MKRLLWLTLTLGFVLLAGFSPSGGAFAQSVYFDDAAPGLMKLGNASFYELGLRKTNGSIAYLTDKQSGQNLALGSPDEQLWGAEFSSATANYIGGDSYTPSGENKFSYNWSNADRLLTFNYIPNPLASQRIAVVITIKPSADSYLDLHMHLQNSWGDTLEQVFFPADLAFPENKIEEALLPLLPGVMLEPSFFLQGRTYTTRYPGDTGAFADYVSLKLRGSFLALYSLYDDRPAPIVDFGFAHDARPAAARAFLIHNFPIALQHGDEWNSPVMRIRLAESHQKSIESFRRDNGLDQLPTIADKLNADLARVIKSPLLKADVWQLRDIMGLRKFTDYDSLLAQLPAPAIFHPLAYQPGGHDNFYPDFIPPDKIWGTTAELRALFEKAHTLGLLVMPYTNPTWWDDESPTLRNLPPPLRINDIAALDRAGRPIHEFYGPNGGYVVSPCHPFVIQRVDRMMQEMTETLPSDFLFEDQFGARPALYDFNQTCLSPLSYVQGWIEHTRKHAAKRLATELGFDRLLATEIAFHGSVLLVERFGFAAQYWGAGNWRPYPLTSLLAHDQILFYQHNLAEETMTANKATLSWNLAFGFMLSYDLATGQLQAPEWREVVAKFQTHIASRYAGKKMLDYTTLQEGVTQSRFEDVIVIANWNEAAPVVFNSHTIPPQGSLVTSEDGSLSGGIFTGYNNRSLSAGDHYFIVEKSSRLDSIRVWQPLGNDTPLAIARPAAWPDPSAIHIYAVRKNIAIPARREVTNQNITFDWAHHFSGLEVEHYLITSDIVDTVPAEIQLFPNYPNPFAAATQISFTLSQASQVKVEIFNLRGERAAVVSAARFEKGRHALIFKSAGLANGIYICRIRAGRVERSRKLLVLK